VSILTATILLIGGWAIGMGHAASICARQGASLADTLRDTKGSTGSDMILKQQMASAFGCAWAIGLWIRPWKWGRAALAAGTPRGKEK